MINREKDDFIPDTTAADKYFIDGFISEEIWDDLEAIARDFLKHHYADIEVFDSLNSYGNDMPEQSDPKASLKIHMLSIMYKAAKAGDEYSIKLFQYLYKTYYKKEYKQLKRFRKISVPEIFSLSHDENGNVGYYTMARIIGMCEIFGIEIDDAISVIHLYLEQEREKQEAEEKIEFFEFPDGLYQECVDQVEQWMEEESSKNTNCYAARYYDRLERFVDHCLRRNGYPGDYVYRSNPYLEDPCRVLSTTLALLKSSFPKEKFTYKEVQTFAHIYQALEALVYTCDEYYESMVELLGIPRERDCFIRESLFHPEDIVVKKDGSKSVIKNNISTVPVKRESNNEEAYIDEIAQLRKKLREMEQESKYYKQQYAQAQKNIKETNAHIKKYENDRNELIALRNYVYSLSEEESSLTETKIEDMKSLIQNRKIAIIGGHTNWINKVKKEFP